MERELGAQKPVQHLTISKPELQLENSKWRLDLDHDKTCICSYLSFCSWESCKLGVRVSQQLQSSGGFCFEVQQQVLSVLLADWVHYARNISQAQKKSGTIPAPTFPHFGDKYQPDFWNMCSIEDWNAAWETHWSCSSQQVWTEAENFVCLFISEIPLHPNTRLSEHCTLDRQLQHTVTPTGALL